MINFSNSRTIALIVSVIISIVAGLLSIGLVFVINQWIYILVSVLVVFLSSFIVLYYTLNNFIIEKLKPVYKTIDSISIPASQLYEKVEDKDILEEVKHEVIHWAKSRVKEIEVLKANEKYRKEFLGDVSHELKTPIFNIQGYVLTLLDGGIDDVEINLKYLKRAEKNINRMIDIIRDLETISKLEVGELDLKFEKFNISEVIREVFLLLERDANENKIRLKLDQHQTGLALVFADRTRMLEVIMNLISNSIRYGKKDGETIVHLSDAGSHLLIEVVDNGIGIEQANLNRIFERFYRVDKSRSKKMGGTGLGLAIVKHILDAHNQKINVKSQIGKGTIFSFLLPRQ